MWTSLHYFRALCWMDECEKEKYTRMQYNSLLFTLMTDGKTVHETLFNSHDLRVTSIKRRTLIAYLAG